MNRFFKFIEELKTFSTEFLDLDKDTVIKVYNKSNDLKLIIENRSEHLYINVMYLDTREDYSCWSYIISLRFMKETDIKTAIVYKKDSIYITFQYNERYNDSILIRDVEYYSVFSSKRYNQYELSYPVQEEDHFQGTTIMYLPEIEDLNAYIEVSKEITNNKFKAFVLSLTKNYQFFTESSYQDLKLMLEEAKTGND